jgi:hypothetical protein
VSPPAMVMAMVMVMAMPVATTRHRVGQAVAAEMSFAPKRASAAWRTRDPTDRRCDPENERPPHELHARIGHHSAFRRRR